ncbi:MAG TPA: DUF4143 domain-containing protein, partial [Candidatus Lustribacter sp.]|nr:DUF4143 domain-containing protein [Candidatus Lustribacter sp.]
SMTVFDLDSAQTRTVLEADPGVVLRSAPPVLVDEWQRVPEVWDVIRRAVDAGAAPGSFLLTGSATPRRDVVTHSGAGRIVSLRMRPMGLSERDVATPTVSLSALLDGAGSGLDGSSALTLPDYVEEIERSGYPGIRSLPPRARRAQLDGYLTRVLSRDLDEQGITVRRPASLRAWLEAYAAATSTCASYNQIARAATPGDGDPPAKVTAIRYRDWLSQLWLLDPVPAWHPRLSRLSALAQAPKHHLADPALAMRLLRASESTLLTGGGRTLGPAGTPLLGALFEDLAALTVRVLAQACEAGTSHLRTQGGEHEIDLIVERHDGRVLAIEVKLAGAVRDQDARHLHWFKNLLGDRLADLLILNTGHHAYRRRDGVAVVPLALLGP